MGPSVGYKKAKKIKFSMRHYKSLKTMLKNKKRKTDDKTIRNT